jgi:large subunit ribosomal protein L25
MPKFPELKVEKRTLAGRKVKQLRRQGIIPANIFGKKIDSVNIQVGEKEFKKIFDEVGETGIVEVTVGDQKYTSLISGYAKDFMSNKILHVDFHHVSLKEKVTATIPVHIVGEAPAVKELGGVVNQTIHEVEVEALPTDLPEAIEIDISHLAAIGDVVVIKDMKIDAAVEVKVDPEMVVVSIAEPAKEEVVEETPAEAEVIGEAKTEAAPTEETKSE